MLQWLSENSASFHIAHNAHHDHHTTVARYILHRERLGDALIFAGRNARQACEEDGSIWELHVRCTDGKALDFVGSTLSACLTRAKAVVAERAPVAIAA